MGKCPVAPAGSGGGAVAGSYQGELEENAAYERTFDLGFCPSAVIIVQSVSGADYSKVQAWREDNLAIAIRGLSFRPWDYNESVSITDMGFRVEGDGTHYTWNRRRVTYAFIAFR